MKNVAIAGGMLLISALGAGPLNIDGCRNMNPQGAEIRLGYR